MKTYAMISASMLLAAFSIAPAHSQVAYTNSALNGCYAHQSTSVATQTGTGNSDLVGTLCFDGKGNIVGSSGKTGLSGHVGNEDGMIKTSKNQTGTYAVTNSPGDGMGTFEGKCDTHEFVLRNIDSNGLAHGFTYILTTIKKGCTEDSIVASGGAEYQGPLSQ